MLADKLLLRPWSRRGEYPDANQKEDDYAIISSKLQYVGQEHGTSTALPTKLVGTPAAGGATASAKVAGIVRSASRVRACWMCNLHRLDWVEAVAPCSTMAISCNTQPGVLLFTP